jgi:hypothetical protein
MPANSDFRVRPLFVQSNFYLFIYCLLQDAFFTNLPVFYPSYQTSSSAPCFQIPLVWVLPLLSETNFRTHTKLQQNYSFAYFNFYVLDSISKDKRVLKLITASMTGIQSALNILINQILVFDCHSQITELCHICKGSPHNSDRFGGPPSLLSSGYRVCEADHSTPASAEVRNMWICTSTPPYVFIA